MKKFFILLRNLIFNRNKTEQIPDEMKKKVELVSQLRQLKSLFVQIESSLPNRKERKKFRRRFINEDRVGAAIIQSVINNYERK